MEPERAFSVAAALVRPDPGRSKCEMRRRRGRHRSRPCLGTGRVSTSRSPLLRFVRYETQFAVGMDFWTCLLAATLQRAVRKTSDLVSERLSHRRRHDRCRDSSEGAVTRGVRRRSRTGFGESVAAPLPVSSGRLVRQRDRFEDRESDVLGLGMEGCGRDRWPPGRGVGSQRCCQRTQSWSSSVDHHGWLW